MRWVAVGLLLLLGCRAEPTQTWLFLFADPALAPDADSLRITVRPAGNDESMTRTDPVDRSGVRIASLFLVPKDGEPTRTWEVLAELLEGDLVRATLRVGGGYVEGETRVINAHFDPSTGCASGTECGDGSTCQSGRCVGSCFASLSQDEDLGQRQLAVCGECARCTDGGCDPVADGTSCGCEGDQCRDGVCVPAVRVRQISAAEGHACALTSRGPYCWGGGRTNQIAQGQGNSSDRPLPLEAPETAGLVELALGAEFTCSRWVRSGPEFGRTCWGWADAGAFAMGDLSGAFAPTELPARNPDQIQELRAGRFSVCALRASGLIQCAGDNGSEQLGAPLSEIDRSNEWVDVEGTWDGLAMGFTTTCGLREGAAYCWGASTITSTFSHVPSCIPDESGECATFFASVTITEGRGCGLDGEGRAYCWGNNGGGRLGIVGSEQLNVATPIDSDLRFSTLSMGQSGAICGIALDGGLYCWGRNENGELGTGDQLSRTTPERIQVDGGDRWLSLVTGPSYTCAIREDEQLYCWGSNGTESGIARAPVAGRLGLGLGSDGREESARVKVLRPERVCF